MEKYTLPVKSAGFVFRIVTICAVVIAVSVGLWLYVNGYLVRSKASEATVNVSLSQPRATVGMGGVARTTLDIVGTSKLSVVDVTIGYQKNELSPLIQSVPTGFDDMGVQTYSENGSNSRTNSMILHVVYTIKKNKSALPVAVTLPLAFQNISTVPSPQGGVIFHARVKNVQVGGPDAPGYVFSTDSTGNSLDFQITYTTDSSEPSVAPPSVTQAVSPTPVLDLKGKAISATNLACVPSCGKSNIGITWTDSSNEDGYRIMKDGASQPLATLAQNATTYRDTSCDGNMHTYQVIAYNAQGSQSTTDPSVQCSCTSTCPTAGPLSPTLGVPLNSADLIFSVVFPDALPTVQSIPNVKVEIYNGSVLACPNCSQTVLFTRSGSRFVSPQLSFDIADTPGQLISYSVAVKQLHTIKREYKAVYLKRKTLLSCATGSDASCGQLLSGITDRPLYAGDTEGFDSQQSGFNIINEVDLQKVQEAVNGNSLEGDMNFDGVSDVKDVSVVGRNYNKKGD